MTDVLLLAAGGVGLSMFMVGVLARIVPHPRLYCPGPRVSIVGWFSPLRLIRIGECGYDLRGHLEHAGDAFPGEPIRCPECGTAFREAKRLMTRPRYVPMGRLGLLLWLAAGYVAAERFFAQTHWDRDLPSGVLLAIEHTLGDRAPVGVRTQLRRRLRWGRLDEDERASLLPLLIADLRADDQHWNAGAAAAVIEREVRAGRKPSMKARLHEALKSDDWQQRQYAAEILRELDEGLSGDLLDVTIEGLRRDAEFVSSGLPTRNASECAAALRSAIETVRPELHRALTSDDAQERVLAAMLLCEVDDPPTIALLDAAIGDFARAENEFDLEAVYLLFNERFERLISYCGKHEADARPYLRALLSEPPGPARHFAACLLREMNGPRDEEALAAICDALRDDPWPRTYRARWRTRRFVVKESFEYLISIERDIDEALLRGMESADAQQRLLCAAVAAYRGRTGLADAAAPILLEHVRSNRISDDAVFAAHAVYRFGPAAARWLDSAAHSENRQLSVTAQYLLARLDDPTARIRQRERWGDNEIWLTGKTNDPVALDRSGLDIPEIRDERRLFAGGGR